MIVALEVVPRNREALIAGAEAARDFSAISILNVPDLLRFSLRSWEACAILAETARAGLVYLPHLRASDFDLAEPFPHTAFFRAQGMRNALVIAGDPPPKKGEIHKTYSTGTISFIKKLKTEMPELHIYAAFDPYRTNIQYELDYLRAKEDAGAEGFLSQPFFDLRLLEIYAEYLEGKKVFWGIAPVLSESNRNYWESRNRAIFPKGFRPDLEMNIEFGRQVLEFCQIHNFNLYLMPIRVELKTYLSGVLG